MTGPDGFRHEALLYENDAQFVEVTIAFIDEGLADDAAILVVVDAGKIQWIRSTLGPRADAVAFADMTSIGRNPARIIPAWRDFVRQHSGRPLRGIGEAIWAGRGADELVECRHHEALLNVAFPENPAFWLLCPYDKAALDPVVVQQANGTHPLVGRPGDQGHPSPGYHGAEPHVLLAEPLPDPPADVATIPFTRLATVREMVHGEANALGLGEAATLDAVLAADEVAANSLVHGGGAGTLAVWRQGDTLVCQVDDRGYIADPLVGRRQPLPDRDRGRGLWIANQLCRLLQIRTSRLGTTVRLHVHDQR